MMVVETMFLNLPTVGSTSSMLMISSSSAKEMEEVLFLFRDLWFSWMPTTDICRL